jgi:hypothetical protein
MPVSTNVGKALQALKSHPKPSEKTGACQSQRGIKVGNSLIACEHCLACWGVIELTFN